MSSHSIQPHSLQQSAIAKSLGPAAPDIAPSSGSPGINATQIPVSFKRAAASSNVVVTSLADRQVQSEHHADSPTPRPGEGPLSSPGAAKQHGPMRQAPKTFEMRRPADVRIARLKSVGPFIPALPVPPVPEFSKMGVGRTLMSPGGSRNTSKAQDQRQLQYCLDLRADLDNLNVLQDTNFIQCLRKKHDGRSGEKILSVKENDLTGMTRTDVERGAEALRQTFEEWAQDQLLDATTAKGQSPSLLAKNAALLVLYVELNRVGFPQGQRRTAEVEDFIQGLAVAGKLGLPVSLPELRSAASEHAGSRGPEGVVSPAQARSARGPQSWDHHPVLIDPFGQGKGSYLEKFGRMRGQLFAAFVGGERNVDAATTRLIKALTPGANADHLKRAVKFLRSNGQAYDSARLDRLSLRPVLKTANRVAVEKHDSLIRSGAPVPYEDAPTFVRIALGNEFQRLGVKRDDTRTRNAVSVSLMNSLESLIKSKPAEKVVAQDELMRLVSRACACIVKHPPSPVSVADSKSAIASPQSQATPSAPGSSPGSDPISPEPPQDGPRRTVQQEPPVPAPVPVPRGLAKEISDAADLLNRAGLPSCKNPGEVIAKAMSLLEGAKGRLREGIARIPEGAVRPRWVGEAETRIDRLEQRIADARQSRPDK